MAQGAIAAADTVTLLMGVYNGALHLPDQLDSIARQTHGAWHLVCSDDGSSDDTERVLADFDAAHPGRLTTVKGPQNGFAANYLSLIRTLPDAAGLVGFADQDDIWAPDKIARACTALRTQPSDVPTLYAARYTVWFPDRDERQASPPLMQPASFRNALVENIATGNTVVLNPAAAQLARDAARHAGDVYAQDWWLYLLISGAGGKVIFDDGPPVLLYRQHNQNVIGGGLAPRQRVQRKIKALGGAYSDRLDSNLAAMTRIGTYLTPENHALVDQFTAARKAPLPTRLRMLRKLGLYRQRPLSNIALWGAASLGRI